MKLSITPAVLRWAIADSGFPTDDIASAAKVPVERLRRFLAGRDRPTLQEARAIAGKIRRPLAVLLLPAPPAVPDASVAFRHPRGGGRRTLNPEERRALRSAVRIQEIASWVAREGANPPVSLPAFDTGQDPEAAARASRDRLGVPTVEELAAVTPAAALRLWRRRLEQHGILVFLLPLGEESCRGFSVWDDWSPLIVVNTVWNPEARIFTLLHELGHLLTRTSSACAAPAGDFSRQGSDPIERWCEEFAAAMLLAPDAVARLVEQDIKVMRGQKVEQLAEVARVATKARASLRATALRLIKLGYAEPSLYGVLPPTSDQRPPGGGGAGRSRLDTRRDQLGDRTAQLFVGALENGTLARSDVMDYLDVSHRDVDTLLGVSSR